MFWQTLLKGIAFLPAIITGIEPILGRGAGDQKKSVAVGLVGSIIGVAEGIAGKDIVDEKAFQDGLAKAIEGVVQMLNASVWHKK